MNRHPISAAERERAQKLLEDGASYREVSRTLGRDRRVWRSLLPGYDWTPQQSVAFSAMTRAFNSLTWHGKPLT